MQRLTLLLTAAVVLTGCSLVDLESPGPTTVEEPVTEASPAGSCTDAGADIVLLCHAVDLIQRNYVDDIDEAALLETGLAAISELPQQGTTGDLRCGFSDPVSAPLCEAIDEIDGPPLDGVEAALSAIAMSLDPNSAYLDPDALQLAEDDTAGTVEGIGALVNAEDVTIDDPVEAQCAVLTDSCRLIVVSVFDGSPAASAGLRPGDMLVSVDGRAVTGLHIDEVTELVRGPAGTDVRAGFERDGSILEFQMTRAAVDIPVAEWELVDGVGYLRLNMYTVNAGDQVHMALRDLIDLGAEGVVLDLRGNPGGALQAAIDVTSEFLSEGLVVRTKSPEEEKTYEVVGGGLGTDPGLELWVLIDRGSASASEVTAGALGESGRAVLLGENTFGKNTVQQRFPLGNGGAIKLTVARWVTPQGSDFGAVGIAPDIEAEFGPELTPVELVARVLELVGQ
ncbi:MAG: S41 family peptidase [Acidimicrobiia bacterium]|nr:S41 family peptidase [Acidimicrobiia bacterium]